MGFSIKEKIEKTKNPAGLAAYPNDHSIRGKPGPIIDALLAQKTLNPRWTAHMCPTSLCQIGPNLEELSKENLKADYRSEKTRHATMVMVLKRKRRLQAVKKTGFDYGQMQKDRIGDLAKADSERDALKNDLKQIRSDYT